MNSSKLNDALREAFDGTAADRRVVVRQATDLAAADKSLTDRGVALTVDEVVSNLNDAPAGSDLVERWNWWLGALDIAYGGYQQFTVQTRADDPALDT